MANSKYISGFWSLVHPRPNGISSATRFRFLSRECNRQLNIHEYQAKQLMRERGIPTAAEELVRTPEEAQAMALRIGLPCFLKAQVLSGGRGKGVFDNGLQGGIQRANNAAAAGELSNQMLGHRLRTKQTKSDGLLVKALLVSEKVEYVQEYYLAITIDRSTFGPAIIFSQSGGVDIEQTAASSPDLLIKIPIDYNTGVTADATSEIIDRLKLDFTSFASIDKILRSLYTLFVEKDATLVEINPLVRKSNGEFLCLDAKVTIDDAAASRQSEIFDAQDKSEEVPEELEAAEHGLVYIRLDGNIGNVVNGAGLAMATNDAIASYGGKSANFLDAGGRATTATMVKAFEIILRDDRVKAILVNIYGGITRCDMIAEAIIAAAAQLHPLRCPIVVRLQGTNAKEGQKMITDSGLDLISLSDFGDAAERAVKEAAKAA